MNLLHLLQTDIESIFKLSGQLYKQLFVILTVINQRLLVYYTKLSLCLLKLKIINELIANLCTLFSIINIYFILFFLYAKTMFIWSKRYKISQLVEWKFN